MININKLAIFDIETAGLYATYADMAVANPKLAELWDKRCLFLRDRYSNNEELTNEELFIQKAGLTAEFGRVVCVTFGVIKNGEVVIKSSCSEDENTVLEWSKVMFNNCDKLGLNLSGHTIERFDIPFIWKRMLIKGINPPKIISVWGKKPWDLTFFDLPKFWSNGTWQEGFASLDLMSTIFGVQSPKTEMHGTRVHNVFWIDRDFNSILQYCEGDVRATCDVISTLGEIVNDEPVTK